MRHVLIAICLAGLAGGLAGCSSAGEEQKKDFLRVASEIDEYNLKIARQAVEAIDDGRDWDWVTVTINQNPRVHPEVRKAFHAWRKVAQGIEEPGDDESN
jgi:hypothetical protein